MYIWIFFIYVNPPAGELIKGEKRIAAGLNQKQHF